MLPETSKARMTVPSTLGRLTTAWGRARARTRSVRPTSMSAAGMPAAEAARSDARRADGAGQVAVRGDATLVGGARGTWYSADAQRDRQQEEQHRRPDERHVATAGASAGAPAMRTMARDQVFVGGERDGVHAGPLERLAEGRFAAVRSFLEAPSEALVVGVYVELLAGLGVLHDQRTDVRQLDLASVEEANGQHLVALGEQVERSLPARCADEVGDHEDERAALDRALAGLEERGQVGERRASADADGGAGR